MVCVLKTDRAGTRFVTMWWTVMGVCGGDLRNDMCTVYAVSDRVGTRCADTRTACARGPKDCATVCRGAVASCRWYGMLLWCGACPTAPQEHMRIHQSDVMGSVQLVFVSPFMCVQPVCFIGCETHSVLFWTNRGVSVSHCHGYNPDPVCKTVHTVCFVQP